MNKSNNPNYSLARFFNERGNVVGAGFALDTSCVLTCAHVIGSALGYLSAPIQKPDGEVRLDFPLHKGVEIMKGDVSDWYPPLDNGGGDVACLLLRNSIPDIEKPKFIPADELWGHSFRAFGFPIGYPQGDWVEGKFLGENALGWVQIECLSGYRIQPGFSGGAVWIDDLDSIGGMIVASDEGRTDAKTAFMIPSDVIANLIPQITLKGLISQGIVDPIAFKNNIAAALKELRVNVIALRPSEERIIQIIDKATYELARSTPDWLKIISLLGIISKRLNIIHSKHASTSNILFSDVQRFYQSLTN